MEVEYDRYIEKVVPRLSHPHFSKCGCNVACFVTCYCVFCVCVGVCGHGFIYAETARGFSSVWEAVSNKIADLKRTTAENTPLPCALNLTEISYKRDIHHLTRTRTHTSCYSLPSSQNLFTSSTLMCKVIALSDYEISCTRDETDGKNCRVVGVEGAND